MTLLGTPFVVEWDAASRKQARLLSKAQRREIGGAVNLLAATGSGDVKSLKGRPGELRLRVGDFRVLFRVDYSSRHLLVIAVRNRREAYR